MVKSSDGPATLTVDELAREVRMTVRNVRAHQSRGLLPPPQVRGRTGYYGPEHVARLRLISELQAEGFNLAAIKRVLEGMPAGQAAPTVQFGMEVRRGWNEEPAVLTVNELAERFPVEGTDLTGRAARLGLLRPLGDDRVEVPSPVLLEIGIELMAMGVPLDVVLDVEERVAGHCDGVAREFVELFIREVWGPFDAAGRPEGRWAEVAEKLDRARPLALRAVEALMRRSLAGATDAAFGKLLRSTAASSGGGRRARRRVVESPSPTERP